MSEKETGTQTPINEFEKVEAGEAAIARKVWSKKRSRGAEGESSLGDNIISKEDIAKTLHKNPSGSAVVETKDGQILPIDAETAAELDA